MKIDKSHRDLPFLTVFLPRVLTRQFKNVSREQHSVDDFCGYNILLNLFGASATDYHPCKMDLPVCLLMLLLHLYTICFEL